MPDIGPDLSTCRYDSKLENVLRYRRRTGRHMPFMNVIPPGLDFSSLKVSGWLPHPAKLSLLFEPTCTQHAEHNPGS